MTALADWFPGDPLLPDAVVDRWWDEGGEAVDEGEALTAGEVVAEHLYAVADGLRDAEQWCTDRLIDFGASPGVVLAAVRDELQQAASALAVADV